VTTAVYSDGSREKVEINVTYTSSDPSIAEISASGVVTAKSEGAVLITAEYDGLISSYELTILTQKQIDMEGVNQGMDAEVTLISSPYLKSLVLVDKQICDRKKFYQGSSSC
jgi:large repetitive protein